MTITLHWWFLPFCIFISGILAWIIQYALDEDTGYIPSRGLLGFVMFCVCLIASVFIVIGHLI